MSRLLALCALLSIASHAHALDVAVAPYLQSLSARAVGVVEGRVYEHRRQPHAPDLPLPGASIVLVPRSEALGLALEDLKRHARRTAGSYREAVTRMRHAKETFERELSQAGAADLVRPVSVDADGMFRAVDVPAGEWLLMGSHAEFVSTSTARATTKEQEKYRMSPRVTGFEAVRLWMRAVMVVPGGRESVELTDRNVWFTGVAENRVKDTAR